MCSRMHKVFGLLRYMPFFSITSNFIVFADAQAFGGTLKGERNACVLSLLLGLHVVFLN